jgi:AraC family transcriptional regulator of adaptative response/methylated-DNA-[protein]-cysteine methyltransferase
MEKNMAKTIHYASGQSSLGPVVVATSDRGLAMLEFGAMNEARMRALQAKFPDAQVVESQAALGETLGRAAELVVHPESGADLALDLQGSDFELRVWKALREIPAGTTTSYGDIAARLGSPREAREVAEACAANIVAVAVPCHRVVKKDGSISGYRWGVARKRALLAREGNVGLLRGSSERPHDLLSR